MTKPVSAYLSQSIESYAARLSATHPLLEAARLGRVGPAAVAAYLANVHFLVRNSPRHLAMAAARCDELGRSELARFFRKKCDEEAGHDAWAESDMAHLSRRFDIGCPSRPSSHLQDLIHFLDREIAADPSRYLAYTLFAEYLTVLLGPAWLAALQARCGIPAAALSVVSKHVELDRNHVVDELEALDRLLANASNPVSYLDVLHRSMRFFEAFCDELYVAWCPQDEAVAAAE